MNQNIFSDSIHAISEANFAKEDSDEYFVISVRPGEKITAIIDVMTEMNNNKLPLAKLTDLLSQELAVFAASRVEHANSVEKVAQRYEFIDSRSALGILVKEGLLEEPPRERYKPRFLEQLQKDKPDAQ